jgi:hypothetical protein
MTIPTWEELNDSWNAHQTPPHDHQSDEEPTRAPTYAELIKSRLLTTDDLKHIPRPEPLIDGLLYRNSLAMMYGPSGAGKSFVAVDIAMTIGSGKQWWHGCAVTTGPVLYVIAEGVSGMSMRTEAWKNRHKLDTDVMWHPMAINVFEPLWASALAEVVAELRPVLVVIDTYARATLGLEENATRDTSIVIAHLDMIRTAADCCVWAIHHSGKNIEAGARGASALKGAMDTEIEVIGDDQRMRLTNTKQKDAPELAPLWLKLDPEGDSAVVTSTSPDEDDLGAGAIQTLEALRDIELPGGVSGSAWQLASPATERTFYRHRKVLVEHGLVTNIGSDKQPRYVVSEAVDSD